jgi:hypothetical protein
MILNCNRIKILILNYKYQDKTQQFFVGFYLTSKISFIKIAAKKHYFYLYFVWNKKNSYICDMKRLQTILGGGTIYVKRRELSSYGIIRYILKGLSWRQTFFFCLNKHLIINFKYYSIDTIYIKTKYKQLLADTITPVSLYFKIRDKFPNSLLLESSDYHGNDNSFSYICCNQSHQ